MKRVLVVLAVLAVACGATTAPTGPPMSIDDLKFRVLDVVGHPAYCDPDSYPLARAEQPGADAAYPRIRADSKLYGAITRHEDLPGFPAELNEAQKLKLYRAYKVLRALTLTPVAGRYAFDYTVDRSLLHVTGSVRQDGTITVVSTTPGARPPCPICLAASTAIATPDGPRVVTSITVGTVVWTEDANGARVAEPVIRTGSTQAPAGHQMVHLRLADGRELWASPGHRTADGRALGSLHAGDTIDGSRVSAWELVPYTGERTYDLLPAGTTGVYWADGIPLASTLS